MTAVDTLPALAAGDKVIVSISDSLSHPVAVPGRAIAVDHQRQIADVETPYCVALGLHVTQRPNLPACGVCWRVDGWPAALEAQWGDR